MPYLPAGCHSTSGKTFRTSNFKSCIHSNLAPDSSCNCGCGSRAWTQIARVNTSRAWTAFPIAGLCARLLDYAISWTAYCKTA